MASEVGIKLVAKNVLVYYNDLGKAVDHEMEGSGCRIRCRFAKKFGESRKTVINAIESHHGDVPAT